MTTDQVDAGGLSTWACEINGPVSPIRLQIAHLLLQLVERGSLLTQEARKLFGSLKGMARRLAESIRNVLIPADAIDSALAAKIQSDSTHPDRGAAGMSASEPAPFKTARPAPPPPRLRLRLHPDVPHTAASTPRSPYGYSSRLFVRAGRTAQSLLGGSLSHMLITNTKGMYATVGCRQSSRLAGSQALSATRNSSDVGLPFSSIAV